MRSLFMKDQYVADIGDYGKYSLLRAFAKEGYRQRQLYCDSAGGDAGSI